MLGKDWKGRKCLAEGRIHFPVRSRRADRKHCMRVSAGCAAYEDYDTQPARKKEYRCEEVEVAHVLVSLPLIHRSHPLLAETDYGLLLPHSTTATSLPESSDIYSPNLRLNRSIHSINIFIRKHSSPLHSFGAHHIIKTPTLDSSYPTNQLQDRL